MERERSIEQLSSDECSTGKREAGLATFWDRVTQGDCTKLMRHLPSKSIDLIVTDPPYGVNYHDRGGRRIINDDNICWLHSAFLEENRVLKDDSFCISFYGWQAADKFVAAWKDCGFRIAGHFVFVKRYASSFGYTRTHHESAYLLVKGRPLFPANSPKDVMEWEYTGNKLHPTQKPVAIIRNLIEAYSKPNGVVLDPFAGSSSTAVAARSCNRHFVMFEIDPQHCTASKERLLPVSASVVDRGQNKNQYKMHSVLNTRGEI